MEVQVYNENGSVGLYKPSSSTQFVGKLIAFKQLEEEPPVPASTRQMITNRRNMTCSIDMTHVNI